jgi:hypothetical protein
VVAGVAVSAFVAFGKRRIGFVSGGVILSTYDI